MLKGNKGEWSEIYAFCYLLNTGKLYSADKDLNALESIYFPVLKIIREEVPNSVYSYEPGEAIKIFLGETLIKEISRSEFENVVSRLYEKIPQGKKSFEIAEVNDFFDNIYCSKLKASSSRKEDIVMKIQDIHTGISPICGFSIKSHIGSKPTLINAGENTNFIFNIIGCNDEIMSVVNGIESKTKNIDKIEYLLLSGCSFQETLPMLSTQFEENLCFIDTIMPRFLSLAVLYSYVYRIISLSQVIEKMKEINPLNFKNTMMYEYKFKKFLCACALGMTPEKQWEGSEDANGGYIVVKNDGSVVCYHIYNRTEFEQYLYDYTFFERASTSRHHYMYIYKEENQYKIKLNLQVRFK